MKHAMRKLILGALAAAAMAAPALAQSLALKVEHDITVLGADGVTRINRFSERLVRQDGQSWVVRILPPHAHEDEEHQAGRKEHKHMDLAAAARWVVRGADGQLRVRLVNLHEQKTYEVGAPDYANIGFDGKWTTASQLLDPEQLRRMKPAARPAPAGARWYEGGTQTARVQVLWDEKERYPRRIESTNPRGTSRSITAVTREPMPAVAPWAQAGSYAQKDYSDLLD